MTGRVIVIGAGAAGLAAAVAASRAGASVTVLEAMDRPGKKLLLTGNGRCNLTNMDPDLSGRYRGGGSELARSVTERITAAEIRSFFEALGLLTAVKNGYVYPYSAQSCAVLETLLSALRANRVKLKLNERVLTLRPDAGGGGWDVQTASWNYTADAVLLACGSKCLARTGSDGSGYDMAARLGHTVVPPQPALAPLFCKESFFPAVSGVRCRAAVTLLRNGQVLCADTGELQWTKHGVSGIVIFQLSRFVSAGQPDGSCKLSIDLLPDFDGAYLAGYLRKKRTEQPRKRVSELLCGMIHEKLVPVVLERAFPKEQKLLLCEALDDRRIALLAAQLKGLSLTVSGTGSFDDCQVCAGGVDCREVFPDTLESRLHRRLFFAGELLDVDGPCGGYNLHWAWASGITAGCAAAHACRETSGGTDEE